MNGIVDSYLSESKLNSINQGLNSELGVKEKASEVCAVTIEYKKEGEKRYAAWILGKFDGEWLILSQIPISSKSSEDYSELLNNIRNYKDHFEDDSDEDYEDD